MSRRTPRRGEYVRERPERQEFVGFGEIKERK